MSDGLATVFTAILLLAMYKFWLLTIDHIEDSKNEIIDKIKKLNKP